MSIPYFPDDLPQTPRRGTWSGGPRDFRRVFQPEIGEPMIRRGTTAELMVYDSVVYPNLGPLDRKTWESFVTNDLQDGSLAFSYREPDTGVPYLWKIVPGDRLYTLTNKGADLRDLSVSLLRRPGNPWWQIYVDTRPTSNRVPEMVANYTGNVFGVDGIRGKAADVAALSGRWDVYRTATGGTVTVTLNELIAVGGFPATAPGGITRIVAYRR